MTHDQNNRFLRFHDFITVFIISLFCICLELFFTRILNLKTSNHVVYVIIPFAILGYGVGANLYLIFSSRIRNVAHNKVLFVNLILIAFVGLVSSLSMVRLPINVEFFEKFFHDFQMGFALVLAYLLVMLPFVIIGFLNLYLFSIDPKQSPKLYFWNLLGSGCGALAFFFFIYQWQIIGSMIILSGAVAALAFIIMYPKMKWIGGAVLAAGLLCGTFMPEPVKYHSDSMGWENFPNYFTPNRYETLSTKWHPLGRTDAYHIVIRFTQEKLYASAPGTFGINLKPFPDYTYFSTNFLGGTPVYNLSDEGLKEYDSKLVPFLHAMEFPYTLRKNPKVVVIGAGGGRDVFLAKTHNAQEVVGAEINPEIHKQMSMGGRFYDYSGRIYDRDGTKIYNIDGRHLVKKLQPNYYDLVVLNGVDTFSGLSTGAYMYSESYLYTVNAIRDYLRTLNDDGLINFNRWIFPDKPRESLRLMVIIMKALEMENVKQPWNHIIIGDYHGWGMTLVKKTPFTPVERALIRQYFPPHHVKMIYPSKALETGKYEDMNPFDLYAISYRGGKEKNFINNYGFDVSYITDDSPFFYKYFKFKDFKPNRMLKFTNTGGGFLVFLIQILVLVHAVVFSLLFIGLPLLLFKREDLKNLPGQSVWAFILYFACLGVGFMFVEIPLMQKFGVMLGSPIYSISVTLAAVLISAGIGSYLLPKFQKKFPDKNNLMLIMTGALTVLLLIFILFGTGILNAFIVFPFIIRILIACLIIAPFGICLGMFFPSGLQLINDDLKGAMAWAWGINCGFSVFGSMFSIILAQFVGFSFVLLIALFIYWLAAMAYGRLLK